MAVFRRLRHMAGLFRDSASGGLIESGLISVSKQSGGGAVWFGADETSVDWAFPEAERLGSAGDGTIKTEIPGAFPEKRMGRSGAIVRYGFAPR